MDSVIVYPENEEQLSALKAFVQTMKMSFEEKPERYPAHVLKGVRESFQEAKEGKLTKFISVEDMLK